MLRKLIPFLFFIPPVFVGYSWISGTPKPVTAADLLFYASLALMLAGGILYIARHEVTDTFARNWKRFFRTGRREAFIREKEGRAEKARFKKEPLPARPVFLFGLYCFTVSLIASFLLM
ncbi:DUF3899 domain-containing protein [Edaphobacillus lindanitolerans]|uniref:DUF3899 domain-containing protein n=1 Tax=Edaphobacillus lindanitolerans TaxID=550447 RepID=A0A1U7PP49_9BACI|nr:DUF3899 domain-containing protein [Edaphobacillus lindanitolerans]SIT87189.1 protein of unknown function [Edaphobacillus lindanitolerans]